MLTEHKKTYKNIFVQVNKNNMNEQAENIF